MPIHNSPIETHGARVTHALAEEIWEGQQFLFHGSKYQRMTEDEISMAFEGGAPADLLAAQEARLRRNGRIVIAFLVGSATADANERVVAIAYGTPVLALIPRRVRRPRKVETDA